MTGDKTSWGLLRPGGRTERVRQKVAQAVLDLLEQGIIEFSHGDVAKRSGVHRTTIYRRWPQRTQLILEALSEHTREIDVPDTGSWSEDIEILSAELARYFSSPIERHMGNAMLSDPSSDTNVAVINYWKPLLEELSAPVVCAQHRGELSEQIDAKIIVQILINAMVMHTLVMREPVPDDLVTRLTTIFTELGTSG